MFLPDDYEAEKASMFTLEKLDMMIRQSSLQEKEAILNRLYLMSEAEAEEMIAYVRGYLPLPGRDCTPHTLEDKRRAIQYNIDKDDFHEERWKD